MYPAIFSGLHEQLGANIRTARLKAGLTQEDLSRASGIHAVEISRMESSMRDMKISTLLKLCRALGMTPNELLDGVDESS